VEQERGKRAAQRSADLARAEKAPAEDALRDLQRQAGNKAVADLLSQQPAQREPSSPGIRLRDALRANRTPVQREFGLALQRIGKDDLKQPGRLLRRGDRGSDVATVLQLLGVNADGIFGRQTRAKVVEFHGSAGLAADGIVGPLTWSALTSATASTGKLPATIDKIASSTDKLAPESTDKLAPESTDKLAPESTDKMASSTDKLPSDTTEKLAPESTDKMASSTDKIPSSTDKLASSTEKLPPDTTDKLAS
jgi:peptidoglycan hydrolase-like protein with peptidoglycan-binding domain